MRYLIMIAFLGLTSSLAFADGDRIPQKNKDREVEFDCTFHGHGKKGLRCTVTGEVCVEWEKDRGGPPPVNGASISPEDTEMVPRSRRCDKKREGRDDSEIRVSCSNGFHADARAKGFVDRDGRRDADLIIFSKHSSEKIRLEIEDVKDFFKRGDDDDFSATLFVEDLGELQGSCRLDSDHRGRGRGRGRD